ncbi:MAG: DUF5683 domain-containing protein [Balneola sp.]|jgi:hypothetical protein
MIKKIFSAVILFLLISPSNYSQKLSSTQGWVHFQSNVDSFLVVVDQDFNNAFYVLKDSFQVEYGEHSLILVHPDYEDIRTRFKIQPNSKNILGSKFWKKIEKDSTLSSFKRINEGLEYNITIVTDENSLIVIDDSTYGKGYLKTDIGPYNHLIEIIHPTARDLSEKIYITPSGQKQLTLFAKPKKATSFLLAFVPSASQWYKNEKTKATVLTVSSLSILTFALLSSKKYTQLNDEYDNMLLKYQGISEEQEAFEFGNLVQKQFDRVEKTAKFRDLSILFLASIYTYNLVDAIFSKPKSGYQLSIEPSYIPLLSSQYGSVNLKVNF